MSVERLTDAEIESLLAGSSAAEPLLGEALSGLREAAIQPPKPGAAVAHLAAIVQAVGQAPTSLSAGAASTPKRGLTSLLPRLAAMSLAGFVALSMTAAAAANGVLGDTAQNVVQEIGQQAGFFAEPTPTEDLTDPTPPSLVPVTGVDDELEENDPADSDESSDDTAGDDAEVADSDEADAPDDDEAVSDADDDATDDADDSDDSDDASDASDDADDSDDASDDASDDDASDDDTSDDDSDDSDDGAADGDDDDDDDDDDDGDDDDDDDQ